MTEYAVDDVVRVCPDAAPHTGQCGVVVRVLPQWKHSLSIEFDCGDHYEVLAYAPAEVELVRAEVSAPRVVTVVV